MANDKLIKLVKYADSLKSKLTDPTPEKHKHRPTSYKEYLQRELSSTTKKIEELQMLAPAGKK